MCSFYTFLQTIKTKRLRVGALDMMFKTKIKELNKIHLISSEQCGISSLWTLRFSQNPFKSAFFPLSIAVKVNLHSNTYQAQTTCSLPCAKHYTHSTPLTCGLKAGGNIPVPQVQEQKAVRAELGFETKQSDYMSRAILFGDSENDEAFTVSCISSEMSDTCTPCVRLMMVQFSLISPSTVGNQPYFPFVHSMCNFSNQHDQLF